MTEETLALAAHPVPVLLSLLDPTFGSRITHSTLHEMSRRRVRHARLVMVFQVMTTSSSPLCALLFCLQRGWVLDSTSRHSMLPSLAVEKV